MLSPAEKVLMNFSKSVLIYKAKEYGLCIEGNKSELAKRIAEKEGKDFSRAWDAIANPKK